MDDLMFMDGVISQGEFNWGEIATGAPFFLPFNWGEIATGAPLFLPFQEDETSNASNLTNEVSSPTDVPRGPLGLKLTIDGSLVDQIQALISEKTPASERIKSQNSKRPIKREGDEVTSHVIGKFKGPATVLRKIKAVLSEYTLKSTNSKRPISREGDVGTSNVLGKLKASNVPATFLGIGDWQRFSENEGDVIAKIYYAKKKLIWEILESGLKRKMEIEWSDIATIRATFGKSQSDILEVELNQPPTFSRETNPQPRKHTIWQAADDFTANQASTYRRHFLTFPKGTLQRHYERLLSCDSQLQMLSQIPYPRYPLPHFKPPYEMQQCFANDLEMNRPMFSPSNCHQSQLSRIMATNHNVGCIGCVNHVAPVHEHHSGLMAMNFPNSDFPPNMEHNALAMVPRTVFSENEYTAVRDQELQNFEPQHYIQAVPLNAVPHRFYTSQYQAEAENIGQITTQVQLIGEQLMSDKLMSPGVSEQKILARVKSLEALFLDEGAN